MSAATANDQRRLVTIAAVFLQRPADKLQRCSQCLQFYTSTSSESVKHRQKSSGFYFCEADAIQAATTAASHNCINTPQK